MQGMRRRTINNPACDASGSRKELGACSVGGSSMIRLARASKKPDWGLEEAISALRKQEYRREMGGASDSSSLDTVESMIKADLQLMTDDRQELLCEIGRINSR
jgi:hypothetical protein